MSGASFRRASVSVVVKASHRWLHCIDAADADKWPLIEFFIPEIKIMTSALLQNRG